MGSITDTPGYFSRTVHTLDFVESKFPNPTKTEMSYTGPPSHLQNSMDVHPFWSEFGREFQPTDRYHDMTNGDVPRGLLPGTDTAQEMRNLELKESLQDLRSQVKAKIKQVRPILEEDREEEQKPKAPADEVDAPVAPVAPVAPDAPVAKIDGPKRPAPPLPVQKLVKPQPELPKDTTSAKTPTPVKQYGSFQDEKSALDFLDSVISESMNLDDEDEVEVTTPATTEDTNWSLGGESFMKVEMRRRNLDKPVPGVMHGVAPVGTRNSFYTTDNEAAYNGGKNVLRTSMYLPESDFTSSTQHSCQSKPAAIAHELQSQYATSAEPSWNQIKQSKGLPPLRGQWVMESAPSVLIRESSRIVAQRTAHQATTAESVPEPRECGTLSRSTTNSPERLLIGLWRDSLPIWTTGGEQVGGRRPRLSADSVSQKACHWKRVSGFRAIQPFWMRSVQSCSCRSQIEQLQPLKEWPSGGNILKQIWTPLPMW